MSSVRDFSPSELQVLISREKPEIISDFFASHSPVMQSGSSAVVSGSKVSHFDSVQLTQSAAVEVSPLTRTQSRFDSVAIPLQSQTFIGCAPTISHSFTANCSLSNSVSLNLKDFSTFSNIINFRVFLNTIFNLITNTCKSQGK